jgi:hypothetical protein
MTQLPAGIPDRYNFRMRRRVIGRRHPIAPPANHLTIPDDHAPKRPTPAILHSLTRQPDRLPQICSVHFCDHGTNLLPPPPIDENFGRLCKKIHNLPHPNIQTARFSRPNAIGPPFAYTFWLLIGYWILATAWISIWASFFYLYI